MIAYFNDMSPKVWWMVNVGMPQLFHLNTLTSAQKNCQVIEDHATRALCDALSLYIFREMLNLPNAHAMWVKIQEKYENLTCLIMS